MKVTHEAAIGTMTKPKEQTIMGNIPKTRYNYIIDIIGYRTHIFT